MASYVRLLELQTSAVSCISFVVRGILQCSTKNGGIIAFLTFRLGISGESKQDSRSAYDATISSVGLS